MKPFIHALSDFFILFAITSILSVALSFGLFTSIQTNILFIFPIVLLVKLTFVYAKIVPYKDKINKLEKENEEKDKIISRFIELDEK